MDCSCLNYLKKHTFDTSKKKKMKLVFASNNKKQNQRISTATSATIEIVSLEDIGCYEEILETADTIEGNSVLKANYVTEKYGYDCFADDTDLK
jgi:XTP/dITP diphosphohydrolase